MENHEIILGSIFDDIIQIVRKENNDIIAYFNIIIGKERYDGYARMVEAETYDILVFYLLKTLFEFDFPITLCVNYKNIDYIVCKNFIEEDLKEKYYYPNSENNYWLRLELAKLIFLCKFVGCSVDLNQIKLVKGFPTFWKCASLGVKNCKTINDNEFFKIFGLTLKEMKSGKRNKLVNEVLEHFNSINFDTDVLRGYLHLHNQELKRTKGHKVKFKLSRRPREIEDVIEQNYSLFIGENPFNIFNV